MSRKYRQQGYQQDERHRERPAMPRVERPEGPRGRGLGAPKISVFRCARCGHRQTHSEVELEAVCEGCGSDLHTCTNCRYFDSMAMNQCRADVPEPVSGKSSRNDCELFEAKQARESGAEAAAPADPRAAFDALFDL